ncbi:flagellar export chaperone FliS [Paenibacillus validus]|uniref:Flagellar secretion chaperone FliS n=1 Tax=Paenibacillus validus TaxID=44253 RepID=A0A7X2ZDZ2_9BACL|nr:MULTISPECIES: flagellar export chaperone FliS [Paenibacillus]MED4601262.1 flagellar export chaperone FliS [Paenibacillus validus]MED4605467.1 flagellar export chaperone FliS [Paenibacillus validus]MUG72503.1 flagellar export chaperone FliS [Paenibacillus validus]
MIPAQNKYLATAVQTATPAQLLIMLYDGAIRFCRLGIQGIKQRKFDDVNYNLCKAQEILRELAMTANPNMEISENLVKLYDYFVFRLIEANTKKVAEPAEEVLGYLVELKETWVQAAKLASAQAAGITHG